MPGIAVAGLGAILIALLAAILVYGVAQLLRPLLVGLLAQLPGLFPFINARQADLMVAVWNAGRRLWDSAVGPLTDFIQVLHWAFWNLADNYIRAIEASLSAIWRVKNWTIPWYFGKATELASHLFLQALDFAQQLAQTGQLFAQSLFSQAILYAETLAGRQQQYSQDLHSQAVQYTDATSQRDVGYTNLVRAELLAYIGVWGDSLVRREAEDVRRLEEWVRGIEAGIEHWVTQGLSADAAYSRALAEQQARALELGLTAVQVQALSAVAELERRPCNRYCSQLGDLGRYLQQAEEIGLAALLLELAGEMFRDARGTARAVDGIGGPIIRDLLGEMAALAGVRTAA